MTIAGNAQVGPGRVLFVGAGPGNPDLLTVRAREVLENTAHAWVDPNVLQGVRDLVGTNVPVPQDKLDAAQAHWEALVAEAKEAGARRKPPRPEPPTAAEITLVTVAGFELSEQDANQKTATSPKVVAQQMAECIATGRDAIRLVAGNPLSQSHVLDELREVEELGVEFQVIPGMTDAVAVPAFTGIGVGPSVTEADIREDADWDQLAAAGLPLILTATPGDLQSIAAELKARDVPGSTPATVTLHGTTRKQRSYDVTLDTLKSIAAASGPAAKDGELPPELLVTIGNQVGNRNKYSWWENRSLYGWTVLVPRAKSQAGPMSARLASHGAIPMEVPTISVEPPRTPAQMERAIKGLVDGRYHWIVFTSVNAVKATWDKLREFGLDARALAGVRVAAVGEKTAQSVRELGITPELLPKKTERNASGLVNVFPPYDPDLDMVCLLYTSPSPRD